MASLLMKLIVIILLFSGEALAIYAEMLAARTNAITTQSFFIIFLKMFALIALGGSFLILGYMLGFSIFKNIWIVSVASITSILIIEPILAYLLFQQLPTKGAVIGLALGVLGFIAAIFF